MSRTPVRLGGAASAALLALAVSTGASAQVAASKPADIKSLSDAAKAAGRPTANRGLVTGTVNPKAVVLRNGTVQQELTEDSLQYTVVRRNADGTLSEYCVTGADEAKRILDAKDLPPQPALAQESRYEEK